MKGLAVRAWRVSLRAGREVAGGLPDFRRLLRRAVRTTFVVAGAAWLLGLLDASSILSRGGGTAMIPLMFTLLSAAALGGGVLLWIVGELSMRLGASVSLGLQPLGLRPPDPLVWPTFVAGIGFAAAIFPMHHVVDHLLGRVALTGYVVFPAVAFGATFRVARLALGASEGKASRRSVVGVAIAACAVASGMHFANAQFFAGLYPEIHRPMSVAELVVIALGLAGLGASLSLKAIVRTLVALVAVALALLPFVGNPVRARRPVAFFGTELAHFNDAIETVLDCDGDGYSSRLGGGDCDDRNAAISPSAIEVADNGLDDNCIRGDLRRAPRRPAPPPFVDVSVEAWRAAQGPRTNIVLVFIDTLRADRVGALGSRRGLTPNLDALAARSVVFEQARTTAPRTPHALMALLRGRFNGRILEGRARISNPAQDTLVFHLKQLGYTTFARLVGSEWPEYQLDGGWDHLEMRDNVYKVTGAAVTGRATGWLAAAPSPFLMMLHYADPHAPYDEHAESPSRHSMVSRYDGEVAYTDEQLGLLLTELEARGRLADTLVLAFGDHGENLGDHGDAGGIHGNSLFDEVLRIPIILYAPGSRPARVSTPISIADVAPTLLDLVGGRALSDPDGCSLAGYLFGQAPAPSYTVSEFYDFGHLLRAIVKGRYKLIVDVQHNAWLLFDILSDPEERHDLSDSRLDVVRDLRDTLDMWIEERADTDAAPNSRCAR